MKMSLCEVMIDLNRVSVD